MSIIALQTFTSFRIKVEEALRAKNAQLYKNFALLQFRAYRNRTIGTNIKGGQEEAIRQWMRQISVSSAGEEWRACCNITEGNINKLEAATGGSALKHANPQTSHGSHHGAPLAATGTASPERVRPRGATHLQPLNHPASIRPSTYLRLT